ncbi:hypothetical protein ACH5RR_036369 [Cinchona calisaya]|uniref:Pectinesterase inhibitor domain-containing protein n=1 Tax=Cinchona calisaya TaxID=153742 RepID=A0ABD2Y4X1_9GENT
MAYNNSFNPVFCSSLILLKTLLLLLLLINPTSSSFVATLSKNDTDFIRTACESTEYPKTCYKSLSRHATAIQQNPAKLARKAMSISLYKTKRAATYISNITEEAGDEAAGPHGDGQALKVCMDLLDGAVNQLTSSVDLMQQYLEAVGVSGKEFVGLQVNTIMTLLHGALMNEDACMDGIFDEIGVHDDLPVNSDVIDCVFKVMEVTRNAVDLFDSFVQNTP